VDLKIAQKAKAKKEEKRANNPSLPQRPARLKVIKHDKEGNCIFHHLKTWAVNNGVCEEVGEDIAASGFNFFAEFFADAVVNGILRTTERHDRNLETQSCHFAYNDTSKKEIGYGRFEYLIQWRVFKYVYIYIYILAWRFLRTY